MSVPNPEQNHQDPSVEKQTIKNVPTNIITGFLGVGKTSAILSLLEAKPKDERWAILVNEFGEIGVDGSLFGDRSNEDSGVYIREVPGGCMCCAAGLPLQIELNLLLSKARPHRLLIEPTGLGHPLEVLQLLSTDYYQEILDLQKIITLVDARKLSDQRYTEHQTFNQQIEIADTVVGNKQDLYTDNEKDQLIKYVESNNTHNQQVVFTQQGKLDLSLMEGSTQAIASGHFHSHPKEKPLVSELPIPESGFLKAENQGEGYKSIGWRIDSKRIFDRDKLFAFLSGIEAERMKAVFITTTGVFGYNLTDDALTEVALKDCVESRIEIIAKDVSDSWESLLWECEVGN